MPHKPVLGFVTASVALILACATGVSPALAGPCPNEGLRTEDRSTGLPDCRAYELVSPAFTNGEPLFEPRVSANGARVGYQTLGDVEAGDDESDSGALYVAIRGQAGWTSASVGPSAAQFQNEDPPVASENRVLSAELSEAMFALVPTEASAEEFRYYRRKLEANLEIGPFVEVGPTVSPEERALWSPTEGGPPIVFQGASPDLSHVFFSPRRGIGPGEHWFWPGDPTTGPESLYEYVGTTNTEPILVEISPGPEEAVDRPAEHPTLISKCGAELGGVAVPASSTISEDSYNAISSVPETEEGHTVFFTAFGTELGKSIRCTGGGSPPVNELYARIGGAKTVAISEPSKEDCESCDTSPIAEESALFQGANQEGSKVFFLTKQQLFDGARGEAAGTANLYEYDFAAEDEHEKISLIAPEMAGVMRVSEDGSHVYFVSEAALRGAAANEYGVRPADGADNLYVEDTATHLVTFIAALSPSDGQEWSSEDDRGDVAATPEGKYLAFGSTNDVTPDASGGGRQLYRYDAEQTAQEESLHVSRLVRVSVGDAQSDDGNDGASFKMFAPSYIDQVAPEQPPVLVTLGGAVFFQSEAGLTPQALNFAPVGEFEGKEKFAFNVYEYEDGGVYLISDGRDTHTTLRTSSVELIGADPSGSDVFFKSDDALVGQAGEAGDNYIYDARVDGGFPAPEKPTECLGEACQAPGSPPPALVSPASATFSGPGDLVAPLSKPALKSAAQIKAEALAKALRACRSKRSARKRTACQRSARRKYGVEMPAKKASERRQASR
jgi:hypothetical protein